MNPDIEKSGDEENARLPEGIGPECDSLRSIACDPIDTLCMTMAHLAQAADMLKMATSEVLSVTTFCGDVKATSVALSVMVCDLQTSPAAMNPLTEKLYREAAQSLSSLSRIGNRTLAVMMSLEMAGVSLQRVAEQLNNQARVDNVTRD